MMMSRALNHASFDSITITTPLNAPYTGLVPSGITSAVLILRAGAAFETGLHRVVPDCLTGRILIQSAPSREPELHFLSLPPDIKNHASVFLLDPQLMTGGAALMAVRVLLDHGVEESRITLITYLARRKGLVKLSKVWERIKVVCCEVVDGENDTRWIESRYFGC